MPYLLSFFLVFLFVAKSSMGFQTEEIAVWVETQTPLESLYLAPLAQKDVPFAADYARSLDAIFAFDLSNSGLAQLAPQEAPYQDKPEIDYSRWQKNRIFYLVLPSMQGTQLNVRIVDVAQRKITALRPVALSGLLDQDRQKIHLLSDATIKVLFGIEGIASQKILYCTTHKIRSKDEMQEVGEIVLADYDGFNARRILKQNGLCVHPAFLQQDKSKPTSFVFVSYHLGQPKILMGSLTDGSLQRVLNLPGNQLMPALNASKQMMAFISDVAGNPDLFVQTFDVSSTLYGKPRQIFTAHRATQASPSFSPDGQKIAFVSNKDGYPRVYVMDIPPPGLRAKDLKPQLLSKLSRESSSPSWSPDGKKILYSSMTQGVRQIWMYDFQTKEERPVTSGKWHKENPSFAPDSLHFLFNSCQDNACEIYLGNIHQEECVKITSGPGEKRFACFEPRAW